MKPEDCKYEMVGMLGKIPVAACTDIGGSQVIVGSCKHKVHLLSNDFGTQEAAVVAARLVIQNGYSETAGYDNLKDAAGGFASFTKLMVRAQLRREG